jgi:hypothetical protein
MDRIMKKMLQRRHKLLEKGATVPIYKIHNMKFYHSYGGKTLLLHWNRSPGTSTKKIHTHKKKPKVTLGEEQCTCNWERSMSDLIIPVRNT